MEEDRQCFVPGCPNNTDNHPFDKLFPRVPENIKKQWCMQNNIIYHKNEKWHCCDDHFDSERDLVNPIKVQLLQCEPRLRPNAILRFGTKQSAIDEMVLSTTSTELLIDSGLCSPSKKMKCGATTTISTLPVLVDAATQVELVMVDKSTNYRARNIIMPSRPVKQDSTSAGEIQTSQESSTTPSLSSDGFIPSMSSSASDITVMA